MKMGTQRVKEVEDKLMKINEISIGDSECTKDAIVDLSEIITTGLSSEDEDLCISILFKEGGLVEFCKAVACDNRFINAKKEALDLFNFLF
ncbi:hypothetical protein Avbf_10535 [Armadillidium vulgare]|nr:hypothetical protein Avbf_10535 [Armadillidium vulgare]